MVQILQMLVFLKDKKYSFIISFAQMTNVLNNKIIVFDHGTLWRKTIHFITLISTCSLTIRDSNTIYTYRYTILPHLTHLGECLQYVETG